MASALIYLQLHLLWNRFRVQLRRLRQPKYLVGALIGFAYFYFFFFRGFGSGGRSPKPAEGALPGLAPEYAALAEVGGALLLALIAAAGWLFPTKRAALDFTEAEIAFLFPAPISRTALLHYRILRSQLPLWFGALMMMFFTGRMLQSGQAWTYGLGWWLILSALELHRLGAAFTRTRLLDRGIRPGRRRLVAVGVLVLFAAVFWGWAKLSLSAPTAEDLASGRQMADYLQRTAQSGPWFWLLFPLRFLVRPMLADSPGSFALALLPAAGLIAVLYLWVLRSQVSFEEATLEQAQARAATLAAVRTGRWPTAQQVKKRAAPFQLKPTGVRAVALMWKNLISMGMAFTPRFWLMLAGLAVVAVIVMRGFMPDSVGLKVMGAFPVALIPILFLVVPQVLTTDLRQDLVMADTLKTYPLPGWQLVLGEVLASALVLTAVQGACIAWGVAFFPDLGLGKSPLLSQRLAIGVALAIVAPGLNLVSLLIHNAAVLLLPGWVRVGPGQAQGFEAMGRNIVLMVGQMVALMLALVLPAGAFAVIFFVGQLLAPWLMVLPLGALAALTVLLIEVYAALRMLGDLFERLDVSAELAQTGS